MISRIKSLLTEGRHSLVIMTAAGGTLCFDGRGVSDLYRLYTESADLLAGALVADRVTGLGAAALMALGGVKRYYTEVISRDALRLLRSGGVEGEHGVMVGQIINRAGTGRCPLESLLAGHDSPREMLPIIHGFVASMRNEKA